MEPPEIFPGCATASSGRSAGGPAVPRALQAMHCLAGGDAFDPGGQVVYETQSGKSAVLVDLELVDGPSVSGFGVKELGAARRGEVDRPGFSRRDDTRRCDE